MTEICQGCGQEQEPMTREELKRAAPWLAIGYLMLPRLRRDEDRRARRARPADVRAMGEAFRGLGRTAQGC